MNKAETLHFLETRIKNAFVLPQITLSYKDFSKLQDKSQEMHKLVQPLKSDTFVVRSSFSGEDTPIESNAGKYKSILNIKKDNIENAIAEVFTSYGNPSAEEIVLIQPFLESTVRSGVIFSHDPHSGQPYLIDNFVMNGQTDEITSGNKNGFKHVCLRSSNNITQYCKESTCLKLRQLLNECSEILEIEHLDIEYGINSEGDVYIFQARPLIVSSTSPVFELKEIDSLRKFIDARMKKHSFLAGNKTIFGVMPDWNPAEMIGRKPKQLALSLYRELITDSIWAYQRDNYGYKTLRSFPLLVEIGNQPFIDTRVSFNSLLPKGLTNALEEKLVNYYIEKLEVNKHLHDKIEFQIVMSSWTYDLDDKLNALPDNFTHLERVALKGELIKLTRNIIASEEIEKDISRIKKLRDRHQVLVSEESDLQYELYWLLEDCKRWGTLPFAGLARAAFIATQIIKSLENELNDYSILNKFLGNLNTITSKMSSDIRILEKDNFLKIYGHLRPGTYDITSRTYNEAFDNYFGDFKKLSPPDNSKIELDLTDLISKTELETILEVTPESFVTFAKKSIYWREQSKFEFTKNLSKILDLIIQIGKQLGFSRDELAYLDIKDVIETYSSSHNLKEVIETSINIGKQKHIFSLQIELPSVISTARDIYAFTERDAVGNFITLKTISGSASTDLSEIRGKIVVIEGADPGFDWIFQKEIKGLITAYGGANSHMAIRCAELGIPAVIGVGDRMYTEIAKSMHVYIDCANRIIEIK